MIKTHASVSFLGTFALTVLAIVGLFMVDTLLARLDRAENGAQARRLFAQGQQLLERGDDVQAIERIGDAIATDRTNRGYLYALAQAQIEAKRNSDAETTLKNLLDSDSADGEACLLMGRVLSQEKRFAEAATFYHRAIYGGWQEDQSGNRIRAHNELIEMLERSGSKPELLAELLTVQDQVPKQSISDRLRMGELFLQAAAPVRAEDVFRSLVHDAPTTAAAYKGMGEAEFAMGNYRSAEHQFQIALRYAPDEPTAKERLATTDEVIALEPMARGLSLDERYARCQRILKLVVDTYNQCVPSDSTRSLLDKANEVLKGPVRRKAEADSLETNLNLAEQLWLAHKKECGSMNPNSPLALVLAKLTQ